MAVDGVSLDTSYFHRGRRRTASGGADRARVGGSKADCEGAGHGVKLARDGYAVPCTCALVDRQGEEMGVNIRAGGGLSRACKSTWLGEPGPRCKLQAGDPRVRRHRRLVRRGRSRCSRRGTTHGWTPIAADHVLEPGRIRCSRRGLQEALGGIFITRRRLLELGSSSATVPAGRGGRKPDRAAGQAARRAQPVRRGQPYQGARR